MIEKALIKTDLVYQNKIKNI